MSKEFQKVSDGLPAPDWINRSETTRLPDPTLSHSAGLLVSLGHHFSISIARCTHGRQY